MKSKIRNEKNRKWHQRRTRVRKSVSRSDRTWLTVYRSTKHIYAQLIDPSDGRTIGSASTRVKAVVGDGQTGNIDAAKKVGTAIAQIAKEKNIEQVVFNRNGFLYHGRVKALVEAAREAGLEL